MKPCHPATIQPEEIHPTVRPLFKFEPSNILFTTTTGPESTRYYAMDATFWLECLDLMEAYGTMPSH